MKLLIQIKSLLFSFIFGFLLYIILTLFNRKIVKNKIIKRTCLFFIILLLFLLYYIILIKINNGYLHVYFIVEIGLGSCFSRIIDKKWFTHCKKK